MISCFQKLIKAASEQNIVPTRSRNLRRNKYQKYASRWAYFCNGEGNKSDFFRFAFYQNYLKRKLRRGSLWEVSPSSSLFDQIQCQHWSVPRDKRTNKNLDEKHHDVGKLSWYGYVSQRVQRAGDKCTPSDYDISVWLKTNIFQVRSTELIIIIGLCEERRWLRMEVDEGNEAAAK